MLDNKKILIFTATYNEAENIENLIDSIKVQSTQLHILIIDDNSPDGTSNIVKKKNLHMKIFF